MTGEPELSADELERQYNNRALVPDHPSVMARWKAGSEAARVAHPPERLKYGTGERELMDWFDAGAGAPVAVFIHGGYWQALDESWFSFVAPPLLAHGVSVVVPTYDLAPHVSLDRIVEQMRMAVENVAARTGARPVVTGHSAGGHLSACLLSESRARAAVAISGVFELAPLISTSLNAALRLDAFEARRLSPAAWPAPSGAVLDCVVGADESAEFVRQSRDMAERWRVDGVQTRFDPLPGLNHFTVLNPLFDTDSALVKRIAELARADFGQV
ncbi:alpha/beta hydrolase [Brevundimonas sp. PAMC22021]|uniref:alpha/beta hydrolase n=1 Tax=Brevundimonas sp. PAMC22021 TaxID=2861285 RepID=UPI001C6331D3|nr:alpha/beta hydrolase [Brevundimonas sp. PAMC22021]QYF86160.1 alpha/beta hydrolase [Brevundimonas sp. PAMC22021]